jgi:glycosyltransferase involved in cell wall biosynthesis
MLLQNYYEIDIRVRRKAEALVAAGYSVDVLALRDPGKPSTYTLNGVNVYAISLGKLRGSLFRYAFEYLVFFLWAWTVLSFRMPRRRYAIVDVNTLPDFLVFAGIFARWMGAKLVLDMHEITPEFYMSKYGIGPDSRLIRVLEYLERISFRFADHVITINEPILGLLVSRGLPRKKSTVITNAADEARFTSYPRSQAAKEAKTTATFAMMYHGTLTKLYGLDIAIEAFHMAHKEMPGAELYILGSGPESGPLKDLVKKRGLASKIKIVGAVLPSEIPAWLEQCDAGILPIRSDIFLEFASPNKLGEYIVMGKAVIVSRLRAIQYYFTDNALAYVEPNNPADLAKQMVRIYRDSGLRARLAAQAKLEYAPISWDVMKQQYLQVMEEMVGHSGVPEPEQPMFEPDVCNQESSVGRQR